MAGATAAYRQRLLQVRAGTYRDALDVWPVFDPQEPQRWMAAAGAIVSRDYDRTAALTRLYVRQHAAEAGHRIRPALAAVLEPEQVATSLRVTSLVAYATARRAGKLPEQALQIASVRSSGAIARLAVNGGRSVVQQTARSGDIRGWLRVGNPQCDLCKTILGRFYPASTQAFDCHDHCACSFEPVYR